MEGRSIRGLDAQARVAKLRGLKRTVLRCLERDPRKRPTAQALVAAWNHSFDNLRDSTVTVATAPAAREPEHEGGTHAPQVCTDM